MKYRISQLKNNSFFSSVLKVGSGQLIAQLLSLISVPILSRIYPESAYGDQAIIISTASIIINLTTLGLSSAIMEPEDDEESKKIFTISFLIMAGLTSIISVACLVLPNYLKLFVINGSYRVGIVLMWLYAVIYNTSLLASVYVNKKGKYNKLFFNPLIGSICQFLIAIPLGLLKWGYKGFLVASIINSLAVCIHLMRGDFPFVKDITKNDFIYILRKYRKYILFQYPSNFINNTAIEYPTQFLGRAFSTTELGDYSMCLRVLMMPVRLIAAPISTVYFRTATEYERNGEDLSGFTFKLITRILLISVIPVSVCSYFAVPIFEFVLGKTWSRAGQIAAILSAQYVMLFCSQCTSYCRVAIGQQAANLYYSIFHLLVLIISCFVGFRFTQSLIGTVVAISISQTICYIIDMAINFYYLDKKKMLKYITISTMYSALVFIVALKAI